jgi:hypothetical protein
MGGRELQDGFDQEWKAAIVAKNVQDYVKKHDITHVGAAGLRMHHARAN